jgi:hypothetical protein
MQIQQLCITEFYPRSEVALAEKQTCLIRKDLAFLMSPFVSKPSAEPEWPPNGANPLYSSGSRLIDTPSYVGMYVGMHDHSTGRSSHAPGVVTPRSTVDYGISVSTVDNHGCRERGDGESSEYEQAHSCLLSMKRSQQRPN